MRALRPTSSIAWRRGWPGGKSCSGCQLGLLLLAWAEQFLAVGAAEEEGEAVQVLAELGRAVGGVADEVEQRCCEAGGVAGEPAGDELEGLGELDRVGGVDAGSRHGRRSGLLGGAGPGEAVGVGAGLDDVAAEGEAVDDGGAEAGVGEGLGPAIRGWDMFASADVPCCLRVLGSFSLSGSLRCKGRMLGITLIIQA